MSGAKFRLRLGVERRADPQPHEQADGSGDKSNHYAI
jgi:hypothetical protein